MRAVLDANVFISAVIQPEGPPGRIFARLQSDAAFELVMAPAIIEEILRALAYPKLRKLIRGDIEPALWLEDTIALADIVADISSLARVCADPDDDKYVAAAIEGRAAVIVTGDRKFLALGEYQGIRVITPRAFLQLLEM